MSLSLGNMNRNKINNLRKMNKQNMTSLDKRWHNIRELK